MLVCHCQGGEKEIKDWFQTINIAGIPLKPQEVLNAIYSGPFVAQAKAEYSNSQNANMQKWSSYIKGDPKWQEMLDVALEWVSGVARRRRGRVHRAASEGDKASAGLKNYFTSVIDWINTVFIRSPDKEMRGLDWGRVYEERSTRRLTTRPRCDADVDRATW